MSIDCPWSIYSTLLALTFYIPFKTKHSLLSAGNRCVSILQAKSVSQIRNIAFTVPLYTVPFLIFFPRWSHLVMLNQQCFCHSLPCASPNPLIHTSDLQVSSLTRRKYIQVCVQNVSDVNFTLAEVKLTEKQHALLELQSLNTKTQQVGREKKRSVLSLRSLRSLLEGAEPED